MAAAVDALSVFPLFSGFNSQELADVAKLMRRTAVPAHGVLFDVGEPANTMYVLTAGDCTLDAPGDETFELRPPALIGELGALTMMNRSTKAVVKPNAEVWSLTARDLQNHFASNQELGLRFLVNLLSVVAEKVHRDQVRMTDMRKNLIGTQKSLKQLRDYVLEAVDTPISQTVDATLGKLISNNRRVNYRVEPPDSLAASMRLDDCDVIVIDISRSHTTVEFERNPPAVGSWIAGVLVLAGVEMPISGSVIRVREQRVTFQHDLLIDEYEKALEGYLTRAQLLDVLV